MIRLLIIATALLLLTATSSASASTKPEENESAERLANVVINNNNIFENPTRFAYKFLNRTHWVTRKNVIRRNIWLKPGDSVSKADLSELERNLRNLDLFATVEVRTQASDSVPDAVDLIINTEDKLSFLGVAGATFLGGIGEAGIVVNENNVLGLGHKLQYKYTESTRDELSRTLSYRNILVSGNDTFAGIELGQTEVGESLTLEYENRFLSFDDPLSWKAELKQEATSEDYFDEGELVAQVPRKNQKLSLSRTHRTGTRDSSWHSGPVVTIERTNYQNARGSQAETIEIPENNKKFFGGILFGRIRTHEYRAVTGLDTLSFTQDLSLGYNYELLAGFAHNQSKNQESTTPVVFLNASSNNPVSEFNYVNLSMDSSLSFDNEALETWNVTAALAWFNTRLKRHTIGARIQYTSAFNRTGLPLQQSLGEDNGLRGYPAREFNGEQKLLLNFEHRVKTRIVLANIEIGTVTFFDAGWVGDRNKSNWLDQSQTSVGAGIRIGSPPLLGSAIIRLDYSVPLDDYQGIEYEPTISLAIGQVFGFNP